MRFYRFINEAARKQDETAGLSEYSWDEISMKHQRDFVKGMQRKSTTFFYDKWEREKDYNPNIHRGHTKDEEGNEYTLEVERRSNQHITSGGTRDPEKTRKFILIKLHKERVGEITIYKRASVGEDFEKEKKFRKQVEKAKELLQRTFGIEAKAL